MRVLLVRPASGNDRFGLAPFFRVEPLGLEYLAAALIARGHAVRLLDLRVDSGLPRMLRRFSPELVGISCTHAVDFPGTLAVAREVGRSNPKAKTVVGGHAASVFPRALADPSVTGLVLGDGEYAMVEIADALARGESLASIHDGRSDAAWGIRFRASASTELAPMLPARASLARVRSRYYCLNKAPLWAIETARGCPYSCNFCSVREFSGGHFRVRPIDVVATDFERTGRNVFVVDDLFFHPRARSLELARELKRRGITKDWLLVQSRLDTVARSAEVLEAWRPLARRFDVFFGFEAPTDAGLARLDKHLDVAAIEDGVRVARTLGFGVTGNFVVDPRWDERDFQAMWSMVDRLQLRRVGYTILTPLPGTPLFESLGSRIRERDWSHFDMHHVPFEPRLGRERFYELFVESWKRNVVGSRDLRTTLRWLHEVPLTHHVRLLRSLLRARRLFSVEAHLAEAFPAALAGEVRAGPHG